MPSLFSVREPTPRELEILRVLWERGPSTVREVHNALGGAAAIKRTTVLKLMQIMLEKGLLARDETGFPQLYSATLPRAAMERRLVRGFVDRVFGGSAMDLVARALDAAPPDAEDLIELRRLLAEVEGGEESGGRD